MRGWRARRCKWMLLQPAIHCTACRLSLRVVLSATPKWLRLDGKPAVNGPYLRGAAAMPEGSLQAAGQWPHKAAGCKAADCACNGWCVQQGTEAARVLFCEGGAGAPEAAGGNVWQLKGSDRRAEQQLEGLGWEGGSRGGKREGRHEHKYKRGPGERCTCRPGQLVKNVGLLAQAGPPQMPAPSRQSISGSLLRRCGRCAGPLPPAPPPPLPPLSPLLLSSSGSSGEKLPFDAASISGYATPLTSSLSSAISPPTSWGMRGQQVPAWASREGDPHMFPRSDAGMQQNCGSSAIATYGHAMLAIPHPHSVQRHDDCSPWPGSMHTRHPISQAIPASAAARCLPTQLQPACCPPPHAHLRNVVPHAVRLPLRPGLPREYGRCRRRHRHPHPPPALVFQLARSPACNRQKAAQQRRCG